MDAAARNPSRIRMAGCESRVSILCQKCLAMVTVQERCAPRNEQYEVKLTQELSALKNKQPMELGEAPVAGTIIAGQDDAKMLQQGSTNHKLPKLEKLSDSSASHYSKWCG